MQQIKASAGSGKTHSITERFLEYLAKAALRAHAPSCALVKNHAAHQSSIDFGDIMAITFTNAAAAEMKERIITYLKEIALEKKHHEHISATVAKQWIQLILEQYGALNVRTIDSLLHLIVRTAALDLDLPPDFETSFTTEEVLEPIFDQLLEHVRQQNTHTATRMEGLLQAVCHSLLYREESSGFATGSRILSSLRPLVQKMLTENIPQSSPLEHIEKHLTNMHQEYQRLAKTLLQEIETLNLKVKVQPLALFKQCAAGSEKILGSAWLQKNHFQECLLKNSQGQSNAEVEYIYSRLCQCAADLASKGYILRKALELAPFVELAQAIHQELEVFQQQERKIPAATIPLLAQKILSLEYGVSTTLCRLGSRVHHTMLDEFQDTSFEQWNALKPLFIESLSQGGSLTWVGDVKQAIYGWRGGDSALFDAVAKSEDLTCMAKVSFDALPTNWRSRRCIVDANNALFSPLEHVDVAQSVLKAMLAKDCPEHIYTKASEKLCTAFTNAAQKIRPEYQEDKALGGYVTLEGIEGENSADLDQAVHEALYHRLVEDLATRRSFHEITILTRSNTGASKVANWLMEWQIPAITENSLLLNAHPLILESLALLTFLDCPQDNLAFWTILTGSMLAPKASQKVTRPSMEELHTWALEKHNTFLSTSFKERWSNFWQATFAPFYTSANMLSPYNCIQEWYRLQGVFTHFPEAETFLRRFLEIIHAAEERGCHSLSTFLEYWYTNGNDEKAPMPTNIDAVRIMTIHKSKGLQFKTVIIPWTSFSQKDDYEPTQYQVDGLHVLAPCSKHMGDIFYERQADNALEALNVLYVACTRAEEELHVFHTHTPKLLSMRNLASGIEILLSKAQYSLPYISGVPIDTKNKDISDHAQIRTDYTTQTHDPFAPLPAQTPNDAHDALSMEQPMQWLPRLKIFRNPLQNLLPSDPKDTLRLSAIKRGLLMHHCLEQFYSTGHALQDAERAVQLGMHTFALPPALTPEYIQELHENLLKGITWFASLDISSFKEHVLAEQNILDTTNTLHRIDAVIPPTEHYGWRALEYKTGQEDSQHILQLRRYLSLLDAIAQHEEGFCAVKSQGVLIYLDMQKCRMVHADSVSELLPAPSWHHKD